MLSRLLPQPSRRRVGITAAAFVSVGVLLTATGCGAQDGAAAAGTAVSPSSTASAGSINTELDPNDERVGLPCPPSDPNPKLVSGGLPGVTLACLGPGPDVNLAGLAGKPTVMNVWASWCPPCRAEMPMLAALSRDAGDALVVLGVDVQDDRTAGMDFAAEAPIASVYDPGGITRSTLGWTGPPITLFVDATGKVQYIKYGAYATEAELRQDVRQYLNVQINS